MTDDPTDSISTKIQALGKSQYEVLEWITKHSTEDVKQKAALADVQRRCGGIWGLRLAIILNALASLYLWWSK